MSFYCISVRTGFEEKFKDSVQPFLQGEGHIVCGQLHILKKRMLLKTGKEYFEFFFPGYVFLETEETDTAKLMCFSDGKGFLRFLPSSKTFVPLAENDENIVQSILRFGSTVGIVPVTFDEGDRILILDGPFKNFSGNVVAVNRRNKRLNIEIDFMNGVKIVGLTYEEVQRHDGTI
ncbi:MAG: transcription termination/antitermination NusG family protein [Treponema sp.]